MLACSTSCVITAEPLTDNRGRQPGGVKLDRRGDLVTGWRTAAHRHHGHSQMIGRRGAGNREFASQILGRGASQVALGEMDPFDLAESAGALDDST